LTITLKPIHLVAIAFVLGLILTTGIVLAISGGDGGSVQATIVLTPTIDQSKLSSSDAAPTPIPVSPTPVPPPSPSPEPQPVRSCTEIRAAGSYLNDVERDFFLGSCQTPASTGSAPVSSAALAPAAPQPTVVVAAPPAVIDPAIAEAERAYKARAEATSAAWLVRYKQLPRLITSRAQLIDYGSVSGGWANQLDGIGPVPPRFQRAHDQLAAALRALDAHTRVEPLVLNLAYLTTLSDLADGVNGAYEDYALVVGLPVQ
jgi:hypothetical protein